MKKFRLVSFILVLCMIFTMTACTSPTVETPQAPEEPQTPVEPETPEEPETTEEPESPLPERNISPMKAGEYLVDEMGVNPMQVKVTLSEKAIEAIEIVSHNETQVVSDPAFENIPKNIINKQSVGIDAVSGATYTSTAIINSVKKAIEEAGGILSEFDIADKKAEVKEEARPPLGTKDLPATWDMTYDVIVVGGGFAGLSAAYNSATQGANTLIIDKMPVLGGNSKINGGVYAAYKSKISEELYTKLGLKPDTAEKHIEDTIAGGDYMGNEKLVKNLVYGSPVMLDLLLDNGLKVRESITRPGGHYGYRTYTTENGVGADIVAVQIKMLEATDATIMLNTKMTQLYRETNGQQKVIGIKVETEDGYKNIKAEKGVILATGGFSGNVAMRTIHVPFLTAGYPTTNHVGATGEALIMAQEIGANTMQMSNIQLYPFARPEDGVLDAYAVIPFSGPSAGIVYVDVEGQRYVNEGERRDVCSRAAQESGGFPTFSIFGQDIVEKGGFISDSQLSNGIEDERIFKADTFEELVEIINSHEYKGNKISMTAEKLKETIETHNGYIDAGADPDFGKVIDKGVMMKIDRGPYYAIPQWPSVHHTMGGLVINEKTEVKDIWDNVIPGLYAAGEVTGGVHGTNRLGSNAIPDGLVHGYIAGQVAAVGTLPDFVK